MQRAIASWDDDPNIEILGNHESERLSLVSFVVRHGSGYLHHNFVVALLNDLFGIQARGGCSCAGPYGHRLLGIDLDRSHELEREVDRGCEGIKPGWTRVNFNYFIDDEVLDYVLDAVHLVAGDGWRLLPLYRFEPDSGLWRHRDGPAAPPMSLLDVSYDTGAMTYPRRSRPDEAPGYEQYLDAARATIEEVARTHPEPLPAPEVTEDFERLRWFPFPDEVLERR